MWAQVRVERGQILMPGDAGHAAASQENGLLLLPTPLPRGALILKPTKAKFKTPEKWETFCPHKPGG